MVVPRLMVRPWLARYSYKQSPGVVGTTSHSLRIISVELFQRNDYDFHVTFLNL